MKKLFRTKEQRRYDRMHRKHRKELVELAKETHEWDYSWLHDMVMMQIKHMHEYYVADDNVFADAPERIEQLKHVLNLNEELERAHDECSDREPELYKEIYKYIGEHIMYWWD